MIKSGTVLGISAKAAAYLNEKQGQVETDLVNKPLNEYPYWHIERARKGKSRKVDVELILNGEVVDTQEIEANGNWSELRFERKIYRSSWVALRIFPSSHTNPIFIEIDNKPIVVHKSVEWCIKAVEQCWIEKSKNIKKEELKEAKETYDAAKVYYQSILDNNSR